jgi:putative tryptophan/tyrosine transport system substrate-binding protein
MRRRDFIAGLGGAVAWPLVVRAQQSPPPVIGFLVAARPETYAPIVAAVRQGLSEAGYVEGRNLAIEYRWGEDDYDRLPALAADLVRRQVAVIIAFGPPPAKAAKAATAIIPIVFATGGDPVKDGLVASISRPGGNATGVTSLTPALGAKRLELMHELVPKATAVGVLVNPNNPISKAQFQDLQETAHAIGQQFTVLNASTEHDLDMAFSTLLERGCGGLVVSGDPFFTAQRERIVALAARHAVPTIYQWREFAIAGGLVSYGPSLTDGYRRAGVYAGRILKGDKPADLPVEQPTRFEMVLNLKTAKTLGLEVPTSILLRADEVIE